MATATPNRDGLGYTIGAYMMESFAILSGTLAILVIMPYPKTTGALPLLGIGGGIIISLFIILCCSGWVFALGGSALGKEAHYRAVVSLPTIRRAAHISHIVGRSEAWLMPIILFSPIGYQLVVQILHH